jgi:RNA polymerase sigma factor (sigma-70 family)
MPGFFVLLPLNGGNNADQPLGALYRSISLISDFLKKPSISKNQKEIKIMSEKVYVLNVYNTMTGQYELIQVTKEVFQTYRRTKWNIEDSTERFFKHETQMSSLIGGENEGYERFHEFIDYDNTPENQAIEEMVFQSLRNVLDLLPPKDYELVYELYFKNRTERECAQRLGMSQQAVHERKKRILKKIKNNLAEEGC